MSNAEQQQLEASSEQAMSESVTIQQQQSPNEPAPSTLGYIFIHRHMRYDPISIVFSLIILIGGLIGFFTKGSLPSLAAGIIFFILLAIATYIEGAMKNPWPLLVVLASLSFMMLFRFYSSGNFMPSGLIATLCVIMLLRHGYLYHMRRQTESI